LNRNHYICTCRASNQIAGEVPHMIEVESFLKILAQLTKHRLAALAAKCEE
jgi:hypothetical protein